ncbi:ferruginol synthase-like [Coffea eugenioides]|uniref:ferruginol synthase-like n=1 Tax=Coffea eugenioides TaxID=49369 RepID=UPI000F614937|nr:ferruginol synthase-like [Coffea eugenioides]
MDAPNTLPFWLLIPLFSVIWYCIHFLLISNSNDEKSKKLPPGPYPLPVIGNLLQISGLLHRPLTKLSQTYGPLMSLKIGSRRAIVVSSPEIAKEVLHKHDLEFAGRRIVDAITAWDHHKVSIAWLPPQSQWRNLRKICKEHIFSSERLNASQGLRQQKVQQLCNYVGQRCLNGQAIDIGEAAFSTTLDLMWNTFFSVDFAQSDSISSSFSSQGAKEMVGNAFKILSIPNLVDFFPILRAIDPQGIRRRAKVHFGKLLDIMDGIIRQRSQERYTSNTYQRKNDFLETLLDLNQQNESVWSYKDMKHLILDLFLGGIDTSSVIVEWTMAELLRNPEKKSKARDEIRKVIGQNELVQESDISNLPYLQSVIKETFRLWPVFPFLVHQAQSDTQINGYVVPKNADIYVNLWGMGRDPSLWSDPTSFVPERFMDGEIDMKGQHFQLLPFGTGRRMCAGLPLADRMVHLMVASLLHKFEWKLEEGIKPEEIDMTEEFEGTMHKAVPLKAIALLKPL